jgi:8-oxo-dGTP pyrophosphatase MutT (NUDIX family)
MQRHFTSTAFIVDSRGRTLLLWHKRLQRWMPPGGHMDPNETPDETAQRECKEETGLDVEIIGDAQVDVYVDNREEGRILKKPYALLLENIPAIPERGEPEHQHMDFVFIARPVNEDQVLTLAEAEADEMRWFTPEEVEALEPGKVFSNVKAYVRELLAQKGTFDNPA